MKWRSAMVVGALVQFVSVLSPSARVAASTPTYATLQLAHAAETLVDHSCQPLPGVVTLSQQAAQYRAMGIAGVTVTVITGWVSQSAETCAITRFGRPYEIASWDEIVSLHKVYGWTFVGGSRTAPDLTTVTTAQAKSEICGSLTDIQSHGLTGGQGEFAFPDNHKNDSLESLALSCGYDFGRTYSAGPSLQMALPIPRPYWLKTWSLDGGACNDPAAACYQFATRFHYLNPAVLAQILASDPGHWKVVQAYDLVTGATTSSTLSWDCTSPDWREHWSSGSDATEVYCWSDWLTAIRSQSSHLAWVTPAQMAAQRAP
jgi:hypothetical protein